MPETRKMVCVCVCVFVKQRMDYTILYHQI